MGIVTQGVARMLRDGAEDEPFILTLKYTSALTQRGAVSWRYVDSQGRPHEQEQQCPWAEMETLQRRLEAWQQGEPPDGP